MSEMEELQEALVSGRIKQLSVLLSSSPHLVNAPIDDEDTILLHLAANCTTPGVLELLLQHGAKVNWVNEEGLTPLHIAAMWGKEDSVAMLLESGADPSIMDADDMSPIDHAMSQGHMECVELLQTGSYSEPFPEDIAADMTMAETFISMFTDEFTLTHVSQLPPELNSPSGSPFTTPLPATPSSLSATPTPITPATPTTPTISNATPTTPKITPTSESPIALATTSSMSGTTSVLPDIQNSTLHKNSFNVLHPNPTSSERKGSPALESCPSPCNGQEKNTKNPRRELFPERDDEKYEDEVIAANSSSLYFSAEEESLHLDHKGLVNGSSLDQQFSYMKINSPESVDCNDPSPVTTVPERILKLSNEELRKKLISLGEQPGPVNGATRKAYQVYLTKIQAGIQPMGNKGYKGYKYELALVLNGTIAIPSLDSLEQQAFQSFRNPATPLAPPFSSSSSFLPSTPSHNKCDTTQVLTPIKTLPRTTASVTPRSQRKHTKDHFNYLLLDPVVLDRLTQASSDLERFRVFVEAVFYVGKGKNARSMQHLKDAKTCGQRTPSKISSKLHRILEIWCANRGVVSLQLFHNTTADEAFTREACLIEAIGLDMLTNVQRGHVHGEVCSWRMNKRRQLGLHLLHKGFQNYLINTPPEIFKEDL